MARRPSRAATSYDSTISAPASSSSSVKQAEVSRTTGSATTTLLSPAGEQCLGQAASGEHAPRRTNWIVRQHNLTPRTRPTLDLLPKNPEFLRWQRLDLFQYALGFRAHALHTNRDVRI